MLKQAAIGLGALAIAALTSASAANAHSTSSVGYMLKDKGFYQLSFSNRSAPFRLTACRGNSEFSIGVDYYGKITRCERVGRCDDGRVDDRLAERDTVPYRLRSRFAGRNRDRFFRRNRDRYNSIRYRDRF